MTSLEGCDRFLRVEEWSYAIWTSFPLSLYVKQCSVIMTFKGELRHGSRTAGSPRRDHCQNTLWTRVTPHVPGARNGHRLDQRCCWFAPRSLWWWWEQQQWRSDNSCLADGK